LSASQPSSVAERGIAVSVGSIQLVASPYLVASAEAR
jgi:hypothetical protein